jgi:hypothetical protein
VVFASHGSTVVENLTTFLKIEGLILSTAQLKEKMILMVLIIGSSSVVEHLTTNPDIEGSNLSANQCQILMLSKWYFLPFLSPTASGIGST